MGTLFQGDTAEQELEYEEFSMLIARICDLAAEAEIRVGAFERTFARWMERIFVPRFSDLVATKLKVIKNMKEASRT